MMVEAPIADEAEEQATPLATYAQALGWPMLSAVLVVGAWEFLVRHYQVPPYLLPAPSAILLAIEEHWSLLMRELLVTIGAAALGFAISFLVGVPLGCAIVLSSVVERMIQPWLIVIAAVPKVVIAPLFLVWFGFGLKSEVLFIVTFTFFTLIVNTIVGLKSPEPELLQTVQAMGASRLQILRKVNLPSALPNIFAGSKIALTFAPVGAVVAEFVASNSGIGHLLVVAVGNMDTAIAFAAVTIFSVFGILLWYVAELVERLALPWHASQRSKIQQS
jgi:NitT/TauT family transport system permease protein